MNLHQILNASGPPSRVEVPGPTSQNYGLVANKTATSRDQSPINRLHSPVIIQHPVNRAYSHSPATSFTASSQSPTSNLPSLADNEFWHPQEYYDSRRAREFMPEYEYQASISVLNRPAYIYKDAPTSDPDYKFFQKGGCRDQHLKAGRRAVSEAGDQISYDINSNQVAESNPFTDNLGRDGFEPIADRELKHLSSSQVTFHDNSVAELDRHQKRSHSQESVDEAASTTSAPTRAKRRKAPNSTWTLEEDRKLVEMVLRTLPRQDFSEYAQRLNKRDSQTVRYRWKVLIRRATGESDDT
ncbi:hypothetical protein V1512DRAFT_31247 [Lipomyces arxii]|uniref:uncharacterized protein n=1 Tax=Lipomyces arxii TaxID=56418 RepID=UPI0034CE6CA6